jgi:hypothetical protein
MGCYKIYKSRVNFFSLKQGLHLAATGTQVIHCATVS